MLALFALLQREVGGCGVLCYRGSVQQVLKLVIRLPGTRGFSRIYSTLLTEPREKWPVTLQGRARP